MPRKGPWTPEKQAHKREKRKLRRLAANPELKNYLEKEKIDPTSIYGAQELRKLALNPLAEDPETFEEVMTGNLMGDYAALRRAAMSAGFSEKGFERLWDRMQSKYKSLKEGIQKIETKDILAQLDDKIARTMHFLDDFVLGQATAKDLAIILGILIEKRQLLKGEPTAIISVEERSQLIHVLPMLVVEAKRRGLVIDVNPETQDAHVVSEKKLKTHTKGLHVAKEVVGTAVAERIEDQQ